MLPVELPGAHDGVEAGSSPGHWLYGGAQTRGADAPHGPVHGSPHQGGRGWLVDWFVHH